jgi:hypothetical protein
VVPKPLKKNLATLSILTAWYAEINFRENENFRFNPSKECKMGEGAQQGA